MKLHRLNFLFQVQLQQPGFALWGKVCKSPFTWLVGLRGLALLSSPGRSGTAAHSHWESADALCVLTSREKKQLLLVGDLAAWFQEQGHWDCWKGQEESEGEGEVRADKALNHFTFFAMQLGIKHMRLHLAE